MAQPLPLPLPEPPAEQVAELLDQLRDARLQLADAHRLIELLAIERAQLGRSNVLSGVLAARLMIESEVAEHRAELWAPVVARLIERARTLGLDVADR